MIAGRGCAVPYLGLARVLGWLAGCTSWVSPRTRPAVDHPAGPQPPARANDQVRPHGRGSRHPHKQPVGVPEPQHRPDSGPDLAARPTPRPSGWSRPRWSPAPGSATRRCRRYSGRARGSNRSCGSSAWPRKPSAGSPGRPAWRTCWPRPAMGGPASWTSSSPTCTNGGTPAAPQCGRCSPRSAANYGGSYSTIRGHLQPFRELGVAPPAVPAPPKVRNVTSWMLRHQVSAARRVLARYTLFGPTVWYRLRAVIRVCAVMAAHAERSGCHVAGFPVVLALASNSFLASLRLDTPSSSSSRISARAKTCQSSTQ